MSHQKGINAMKLRHTLIALAALISAGSMATAFAATVTCPDLSTVVKVGACPSEEELQYTFNGYCSDNARMYDRAGTDVCTDYKLYREFKNTAFWETPDGKFDGYISCSPGKGDFAGAKPKELKISKQGSVTRIVCDYGNDHIFTHRTKAKCQADAANCATDPAACKAQCE